MDTIGFWPALSAAERGKVAELAVRRSYRRGDMVCREGDRAAAATAGATWSAGKATAPR